MNKINRSKTLFSESIIGQKHLYVNRQPSLCNPSSSGLDGLNEKLCKVLEYSYDQTNLLETISKLANVIIDIETELGVNDPSKSITLNQNLTYIK